MLKLILSGISLILIDNIYYQLTKDIYIDKIEEIQQRPFAFRPLGAIIRYLVLIFGLYYFIIKRNASLIEALSLGIFVNGATNGTMYASFTDWNGIGAMLDTLWMGLLFVFVTFISR